jgi:hypothetical protein
MSYLDELFGMAQEVANEKPEFFYIKGPGIGDKDTADFMSKLRVKAMKKFGRDFSERKICGTGINSAVDFYFPEEATIVEIALTLKNAASEFEKDIIKAILAKRSGNEVKKLCFISKPGAIKRNKEPAPRAIISWIIEDYGIQVIIRELVNMHRQ